MSGRRFPVASLLARIPVARARRTRGVVGSGRSAGSVLPDSVLVALRREGLDPVVGQGREHGAEPVTRVARWFGVNAWLVTGREEVKAVLGGADAFSSDFSRLVEGAGVDAGRHPGGLGFSDPPEHTRLRRLLTPEFTVRRLGRLAPVIDEIIEARLDAMQDEPGPVDLVRSFALPVPALTICELLGVPHASRPEFQELSVAHFDASGGPDGLLGATSAAMAQLTELVRQQRASPGDGLIGMLVREHGDEIEDRELAGLADGLVTGGLETTASTLALGSLVLLRNPSLCRLVRAGEIPVDGLVEELLRHLSVVQVAFPRFARRDIVVSGVRMARGDLVLCSLSAANRAGPPAPGATEFDPMRPAVSHLAFGHGIHRCIGAELARMQLRAAWPALLRRFPAARLTIGPDEIDFRELSIVYGVRSLPVLLA
ncbi:cytochrome P450 [Streptomyces syringium]|uniref:Cytochrome P450 n=1 Tax=Streptomyces syringium TaxID=76729 RepID=A0ABS4Y2F7_9ACTN|nr:cytochrome P450 [Streptomyces syringium]MBP2402961.1 cytochrome P450 [Streptomyces syringium]